MSMPVANTHYGRMVRPWDRLRGKRAAIYARVSTNEQARRGTSLTTQLDECRRFALAQGWDVTAEYIDEGVSGAKASRPALNALLVAVRAGEVNAVVVAKLDRFARSMNHLSTMVNELDDRRVVFATVDRQIDTTTSAGRLLRNILGSFAEFERDLIIERTTSGKRRVVEQGYWPGAVAPYGFRLERIEGAHSRLVVFEPEADVYRQIVAMLVDRGFTTGDVARHLNARGISAPRAREWHQNMLRHLLLRAPLSGLWTYGAGTGDRPLEANEKPLTIKIPAIVSPLRHDELRRALVRTSTGPRGPAYLRMYLLGRGRMRSVCGGSFFGVWRRDRGYRQYKCTNSLSTAEHRCNCPRIRSDDVEDDVWDALVALLRDPNRLSDTVRTVSSGADPGETTELVRALEVKIQRLKETMTRLTVTYAKSRMPLEVINAASATARAELAQAFSEYDAIREWEGSYRNLRACQHDLRAVARGVRKGATTLSKVERSRVLALLEVVVTVTRWECCKNCRGRGKVAGIGRGGKSCPTCHGSRRLGSFRIDGTLSRRAMQWLADGALGDGEAAGAIPFRINVIPCVPR
jgi:site-specific DNA recombinase